MARPISLLIGAALALGAGAGARAAGLYYGIGAGQLRFDQAGATAEVPVLEVKLGKRFNEYVGLEARYGVGTSDDETERGGVPLRIDVERYYGAYALGMLPLSHRFWFYGLAGLTRGEITASAGGVSTSASDVDGSFGVGAEVSVGSSSAFMLEWARLFDESGYAVETLTAALNIRF